MWRFLSTSFLGVMLCASLNLGALADDVTPEPDKKATARISAMEEAKPELFLLPNLYSPIPQQWQEELATLPQGMATPYFAFLKQHPNNLLAHVGLINEVAQTLSAEKQQLFLHELETRQQQNQKNVAANFDYGYALLRLGQNSDGLYVLRKLSDALPEDTTIQLVYAAAMAEADKTFDKTPDDDLSHSKLEATNHIKQALASDLKSHQPGFWPTFISIVTPLSKLPAYEGLLTKDFSASYVPRGNRVPLYVAPIEAEKAMADEASAVKHTTWVFAPGDVERTNYIQLKADDPWVVVKHLTPAGARKLGGANTLVLNQAGEVLARFYNPGRPYVVEDLEKDGTFEIVVRQYDEKPATPVFVYRYRNEQLMLDEAVQQLFE